MQWAESNEAMNISKSKREKIRMMFGGFCAYCGAALTGKWHVDHVEAVYRDSVWVRSTDAKPGYYTSTGKMRKAYNDHIENCFPACIPCNISKGCVDLEGWRKWIEVQIAEVLRRNQANFRHAERFGRVVVVTEPVVFWYEKYKDREDDAPHLRQYG